MTREVVLVVARSMVSANHPPAPWTETPLGGRRAIGSHRPRYGRQRPESRPSGDVEELADAVAPVVLGPVERAVGGDERRFGTGVGGVDGDAGRERGDRRRPPPSLGQALD